MLGTVWVVAYHFGGKVPGQLLDDLRPGDLVVRLEHEPLEHQLAKGVEDVGNKHKLAWVELSHGNV